MGLEMRQGSPADVGGGSAEALIREARERQRRRRRRWVVVISVVAVAAVVVAIAQATQPSRGVKAAPVQRRLASPSTAGVRPEAPAALAAGPGGAVYLIDTGRNEILRYLPTQGFRVVAGDGHSGLPPDGTPALRARLELTWYSGLAVSDKGLVYFTEGGRILSLQPGGVLTTVAGGGSVALSQRPVAALQADLSPGGDGLAGLTFGPDGQLYVGTSEGVYRLGADGELHWVVGSWLRRDIPAHWAGDESNPAIQNDFVGAVHLAFDTRGDLFVAGGNCYCLYERTAARQLRFVQVLRAAGGSPGSIASGPDGSVLTASGGGLSRIDANGAAVKVKAAWPQFHGRGVLQFYPAFGNGLAVGSRGQVFVDSDADDTFPHQGLLEVLPTGRVVWLWAQKD